MPTCLLGGFDSSDTGLTILDLGSTRWLGATEHILEQARHDEREKEEGKDSRLLEG